MKTIRTDVKDAKQRVKESAQLMRELISNRERELLRDLDRCEGEVLTKLKTMKLQPEDSKALQNKPESEKTRRPSMFTQAMQGLVSQENLDVEETPKQHELEWKLVVDVEQKSKESLKAMVGNVQLITQIGFQKHLKAKQLMYEGQQVVTGIAVIGECMCVTHLMDPNLWMYDMKTSNSKSERVPGLEKPRCVTLSPVESEVVIADETNGLIFVKISTDLSISDQRIKKLPVDCRVCGISVNRETRELLIGLWRSHQFLVCSAEGDVHRFVTVGSTDVTKRYPVHVRKFEDGYAVIMWAKDAKGTIELMNGEGTCFRTYGGEQLRIAQTMVIDSEKRLIVVDYMNNRLLLVDTVSNQLQVLATKDDGLVQPDCVYLDERTSRLYVSNGPRGSPEVLVYRWPPKLTETNRANFQLKLSISRF